MPTVVCPGTGFQATPAHNVHATSPLTATSQHRAPGTAIFWSCRILSSVVVLMTVINQLLRHDEYRRPNGPLETISKLSLCCVLFSIVELLKTLGGRILSLRVHSSSRVFSKLRVSSLSSGLVQTCMPSRTSCGRACSVL